MSVESCSPSMARDMEDVCSESSRKMQDKEETTSEASWIAVTEGKEKEVEGEPERPEATVPWKGAGGVSVNPEGESRHGQVRAKITRKEIEHQTEMEEKVDGKAPRDSEKESDSGRIQRNAGFCERIIEPEPGRSRINKFRAKSDQHHTKAHVLVSQSLQRQGVLHGQSVSAVLQRKLDGTGSGAFEELAVEGSRRMEGASWQATENAGERPVYTRKVGTLFA